ncbi:MAG: GvpL/GvpF family gas vesicle protein [Pseudomonadota bacterium]
MTAFLLLGLVDGCCAPLHLTTSHKRLKVGGWTALATPVVPQDAAQEEGLLAWAMTQNAVLTDYVTTVDVLPMPLGAVFSDEASMVAYIEAHQQLFSAEFSRMSGACEYALWVREKHAAPVPQKAEMAKTGRSFLQARGQVQATRRTRNHDRQSFVQSLLRSAEKHSSLQHARSPKDGRVLADVSLLVRRDSHRRLIKGLEARADAASGLGLDCRLVGPSPAYSFAQLDLANA